MDGICLSILWTLIVGGIIGWLAGLITGKDIPGGIIGNILAGIIGGYLGSRLLGSWGPEIGDFYVFPALIGSIILIILVSILLNIFKRN